ncbi:response regulator transcription factor [Sphingomonas sp. 10B4]|uniref:response regulator transcription factor n=1 Tax=Sphingomonas sp. 10B4 TaxID=3048575 RepID=UPI002AB486F0|nr:response regulator [Sphingomonas sp. 10B4]MDY7522822.1 response regulator [Sphingomonas sp. 10B4]MEB0283847.1 response regulator [Sphingomonas sp. 10B4]
MTDGVLILVVEDEALIKELVVCGLEDAGYVVAIASDGEDAIAMLEADGAEFRAVVTDINLAPQNLTGWDVAKRARELTPDIPIIYMSAASSHEWTSSGVPNSLLIAKPFAMGQIVTAVSQLLNAGGSGSVE